MSFAKPELINHIVVATHLCFCVCALGFLVWLRILRAPHDRSLQSIVYGVCLFLCGLCSYLYTTRYEDVPVTLLRHLDHAAIFLLIAGTYTPFATREIYGPFKIRLLYWVWGLALIGIVLSLMTKKGQDVIFVALYVGLGWVFLTAIRDVLHHISVFSLIFLAAGAAIYSIGAILFALDLTVWTDPIWHACVIAAAILHFVSVIGLLTRNQPEKAEFSKSRLA